MFTAKLLKRLKKRDNLREIETQIEKKIMEKITTNESFKMVDERQAAKILKMSYSKIKYLRKQGKIGFLRVGRSIRYKISQLQKFIELSVVEAENSTN